MADDQKSFGRVVPSDGEAKDGLPTYDARRIVGAQQQARIILDGATYTLRITRTNKLILTK